MSLVTANILALFFQPSDQKKIKEIITRMNKFQDKVNFVLSLKQELPRHYNEVHMMMLCTDHQSFETKIIKTFKKLRKGYSVYTMSSKELAANLDANWQSYLEIFADMVLDGMEREAEHIELEQRRKENERFLVQQTQMRSFLHHEISAGLLNWIRSLQNFAIDLGLREVDAEKLSFLELDLTQLSPEQSQFLRAIQDFERTRASEASDLFMDDIDDDPAEWYANLLHNSAFITSGLRALHEEFEGFIRCSKFLEMNHDYDYQVITDLSERIEELLQSPLVLSRARSQGFTIQSQITPELGVIRVDPMLVLQAIKNLIMNAIKYGNGEKENKILIKAQNTSRKEILITVEDRGSGVPSGVNIWTSGVQANKRSPGVGLGLAFVKKVIELYGGRVSNRNLECGTRFYLQIPIYKTGG